MASAGASGINQFTIFSRTGIVLWSLVRDALRGDPVNRLIGDVLLEDRAASKSHDLDTYSMKWSLANEVDLVFVCVYQKQFKFTFIDSLIERVQGAFCSAFASSPSQANATVACACGGFVDFGGAYAEIREAVETEHFQRRAVPKMRRFEETVKGQVIGEAAGDGGNGAVAAASGKKKKKKKKTKAQKRAARRAAAAEEEGGEDGEDSCSEMPLLEDAVDAADLAPEERRRRAREALKARQAPGRKQGGKKAGAGGASATKKTSAGDMFFDPSRRKKISKKDLAALDRSAAGGLEAATRAAALQADVVDRIQSEAMSESGGAAAAPRGAEAAPRGWAIGSSMSSMFKKLTGTKPLEKEDLLPALNEMKNLLVQKNVAHDIAVVICDSVCTVSTFASKQTCLP